MKTENENIRGDGKYPISDRSGQGNAFNLNESIAWTKAWSHDVEQWGQDLNAFFEVMEVHFRSVTKLDPAKGLVSLRSNVIQVKDQDLIDLKERLYSHLISLQKHAAGHGPLNAKMAIEHAALSKDVADMRSGINDLKDRFIAFKRSPASRTSMKKPRFEHVLIPTDFSENAKRATDYALAIFGEGVLSVTLLHVMPSSLYASDAFAFHHNSAKGFQAEKERIKTAFPEQFNKVGVSIQVGDLVERMKWVIEEENIDLVVMGTHGDLSTDPPLFMTVTSAVIKHLNIPVLVVPKETPFLPPRNIVFTTDIPSAAGSAGIEMVRSIGERYCAHLVAILVRPDDGSIGSNIGQQGLRTSLESIGLRNEDIEMVSWNNALEAINNSMVERSVDLLTMVTHQGNLFCSLYTKATGEQEQLLHSHIPVLVLPANVSK